MQDIIAMLHAELPANLRRIGSILKKILRDGSKGDTWRFLFGDSTHATVSHSSAQHF